MNGMGKNGDDLSDWGSLGNSSGKSGNNKNNNTKVINKMGQGRDSIKQQGDD